jgi:hypothetical protein
MHAGFQWETSYTQQMTNSPCARPAGQAAHSDPQRTEH